MILVPAFLTQSLVGVCASMSCQGVAYRGLGLAVPEAQRRRTRCILLRIVKGFQFADLSYLMITRVL
jgi:hypothetical protein